MPEGFEAFEFLDGTAIMPLGLGLIAQEQRPAYGSFRHAVETLAEGVVAVLGAGDFDIRGKLRSHQEKRPSVGVEGLIETVSEEAGLKAGGAEKRLLREGNSLNRKKLLSVDGLVEGKEVGLEMSDFLMLFEADDGESCGGEAVLAGILGGVGLAFRCAGAGGVGGVGAIGGELFGGYRFAGHLTSYLRGSTRKRGIRGVNLASD